MSLECPRHDESGIRVPVPIKEPTPRNRTTVHPRPAPLMHPISPRDRWCGQEVLRGKGLILRASDTHVARAPHGATAASLRVSQTLTEFGMTPSSRSRVSKVRPDKPQINPRAALLTRAKL